MLDRYALGLLLLCSGCGASPPADRGARVDTTAATRSVREPTRPAPRPSPRQKPPARRTAHRSGGPLRFVRTPILVVYGSEKGGYAGVLFARLNRPLGLGTRATRDAAFLLEGHADLNGPLRGRPWHACYFESYLDTFPDPPPKPGGSAAITLSDGHAVRDRAKALVRRGTGREAFNGEPQNRWFRRLGCRKS